MAESRPDPETLLRRARLEARDTSTRGRLKVFLGAAPGVGKTYAMLDEARKLSSQGVDVAVGYVEPHVRPETAALVLGLDLVPPRVVEHHGLQLRELDVDACVRRRPSILIVDELAHSNAPGSRHLKRWQDVEEILDGGINVYTTLNVQHVESLKDVVGQITGVVVRESLPDSFLDRAHEIELVDIAPDELLERLRGGKVYLPKEAERAQENFFRKENLIALRELALRVAADRVNARLEDYRRARAEHPVWSTSDRLLVCVGPSPFSARLVRATRRMAASLKVPWLAAHVERPGRAPLGAPAREQLSRNLRLAEELGAEVVHLEGDNVAAAVVELARQRNVTKIVVGKPLQPRWKEMVFGSFVYELTRRCGEIDVYVMSGEAERPGAEVARKPARRWDPVSYAWALVAVAASTAASYAMHPHFDQSNLVMAYLLGVVAVAVLRGDRGAAVAASVLSVLAFDFCFVPPRYSFSVADIEYVFTFAVMLLTALVTSGLAIRLRLQARWAREREGVTSALYAMSRTLAGAEGLDRIVGDAARHMASVFEAGIAVLLRNEAGGFTPRDLGTAGMALDERETAVGSWAAAHGQKAGLGTATLPSASALWLPLRAATASLGAMGVAPHDGAPIVDPNRLHLLETFANQAALAIERAQLAARARTSEMEVEAERLRNALLSAVSHDLRTPLASIMGASSTLLEREDALPAATRRELEETIYDEAERLNRLLANVLDVTKLEAGAVSLKREWQPLEETVGVVLGRLERSLTEHPVSAAMPADLPLVPLDAPLVEQVLFNLIDNALRHTPPGTPIDITAEAAPGEVVVSVLDRGPGITPGDEQRIFDKFQRGCGGKGGGTGLGLTVSRGIVAAHGGRIWVENRPGGGAVFRFTLPLAGSAPTVPDERAAPLASAEAQGADGG